ncbi:uncharacterized protein PG998_006243 [Apiospora kogelbergensis]|uniref:uncharacterized protein n=1 Tax=Apiospora kogelbergensis TaxID=1337665 RepID=UPI00312F56F5
MLTIPTQMERAAVVESTISDDRTRGSLFETRGDKWIALGLRQPDSPPTTDEAISTVTNAYSSYQCLPSLTLRPSAQLNSENLSNEILDSDFAFFGDDNNFNTGPDFNLSNFLDIPGEIGAESSRQQAKRQPKMPRTAGSSSCRQGAPGANGQRVPPRNEPAAYRPEPEFDDFFGTRPEPMVSQEPVTRHSYDYSSRPRNEQPSTGGAFIDFVGDSNTSQRLSHETPLGLSAGDFQSIADRLGIPEASASSFESMQAYISGLRQQKDVPPPRKPPRGLLIHRVVDKHGGFRLYLDRPQWIEGDGWALMGKLPVSNVQAYLSKYPEVCFIMCRNYKDSSAIDTDNRDAIGNINVTYSSESIVPVEQHLASAIMKFIDFNGCESKDQYSIDDFHNDDYRDFSNGWLADCKKITLYSPEELPLFQRITGYIMREYQKLFAAIKNSIARGKITNASLSFLFKPGTVVVQGKGTDARGYICTSRLQNSLTPEYESLLHEITHSLGLPEETSPNEPQQTKAVLRSYTLNAWYWELDPTFRKRHVVLRIQDIAVNDRSEKDIKDMDIRPKAHVDPRTLEILQNRGTWYWKCRKQQIVAYNGDAHRDNTRKHMHQTTDQRYMIDAMTYHDFHAFGASNGSPKTKKWCDLAIDGFAKVEWNTDAFENLAIPEKTKELIEALISNQIETEMSTDIISGKGNGLIMLLHGGPGTGKTLTAESVAEIAQRPLYPVTCGDIGTEPNAVEKYLESVLTLGKIWGCVVLLDEADVFLEQRSLDDLHRNALVSVFLRVLEYYEGILVLTSNRVGTFDEAFKSRIQLAVHYTNLNDDQRRQIWTNFFSRLKHLDEDGINFADLKDNIKRLARHKMNGREIRNVITTARQFARWKRNQKNGAGYLLNYEVMEEIIETSGKFDQYIKDLNNGATHDQLAEDEGWRLAGDE